MVTFEQLNPFAVAQTAAGIQMTKDSYNKHRKWAGLGLFFLVLSALHPWGTLSGTGGPGQEIVGALGVGLVLLAWYCFLLHEATLQTEITRLRQELGEQDLEDPPNKTSHHVYSQLQRKANSWLRLAGGLMIIITVALVIIQFVELAFK